MRYVVLIILLLLLLPSTAYAKPGYFQRFVAKSWTKTTGWCFSSKWRKLPDWFKFHICIPRRWGAVDVCLMQKIEISKRINFMVGHKITYSKFRHEFVKEKEKWAHGPYLYYHLKF